MRDERYGLPCAVRHCVINPWPCPDPLPEFATGVRVGVRVTGRNRQYLDRRYAGFRSLHYFVDEKIVKLGDFAAVGTLHSYLAARVVMARYWVRPDNTEIVLAIGAHERIVAWHRNSCIVDLCRQEKGERSSFAPRVCQHCADYTIFAISSPISRVPSPGNNQAWYTPFSARGGTSWWVLMPRSASRQRINYGDHERHR